MPDLTHSPEHVQHWLHRVYADTPGLLSVVYQDAAGRFHGAGGTIADIPAALDRIARLDAAGAQGIYLRTTTVGRPLGPHERGGADDSLTLPGLWADVDFGTVGHKPGRGPLPLPPDEHEARRIVTESGLPDPTLWVHSGGGFYPWWLLDEPLTLTDELRPMAADISARWQQALARSAEALGYDYGAGVGDLSRVLRIPGTVNRKAGGQRKCRLVEDTGAVYTLADLMAALDAVTPPPPAAPAAAALPMPYASDPLQLRTGASAFDTLDEHATFDDILTGAGFTLHTDRHPAAVDQCWTRPGDPDSPCSAHTLKANPHVLVVHSELAGLPTGGGQKLTRGRVFAHLHHGGDERAASLDLFAAIGDRPSTPAAAVLPLPRQAARPMANSTTGLHDLVALEETAHRVEEPSHADTHDQDAAWEARRAFLLDVEREADRIRVREAARDQVAAEKAATNPAPPFDAGTLNEIVARPAPPPMRADGLIPSDAGVLVVAQRKTGKTTLELNWARSLLTGEPFLGRFPVRPIDGDVTILNYEVSGDTLARWADEHGIPGNRLFLVNLRGRRNPLAHPDDRERLAAILKARNTQAMIVDPFGRAFTGKSQNDPGDVGSWLVDLDLFARGEVGATDLMLSAHAGWNGERSRGSSALEDWADVNIWMTRDPDDDTQRFLRAEGRDVLVDEDQLLFETTARTLALAGTGSRRKTKDTRKANDLAVFVRRAASQRPGVSTAELVKLIRAMPDAPTFQDREVSKAAQHAQAQEFLTIQDNGPGKTKQYYPATPSNPVQTPSTDAPTNPVHPVYMDGVGGQGSPSTTALDAPTTDTDECPTCHRYTCNGTHQEAS